MEFLRSFLRSHFAGKLVGGVAKCRLFSQASKKGLTKFNDFNNKIVKLRRLYADTKSHSCLHGTRKPRSLNTPQ